MTTLSKFMLSSLLVICALGVFGPGVTPARADEDEARVLGSWKVTVTPTSPPVPGFSSLMTFTPGGGLIETRRLAVTPVPGLIPALLETPGHGAWEKIGRRTYAVSFTFLLQDPASGNEVGTDTIRWTATIGDDGETISGPWKSSVVIVGGPQIDFAGTIAGARMKVIPL